MDTLRLTRIAVPAWAPPHARQVIHLSGDGAARAQAAFAPLHDLILEHWHARLEAFVNDPDCCYPDPIVSDPVRDIEPFPLRARLAGTYYVGTETYRDCHDHPSLPSYHFAVRFRLQEIPWLPGLTDWDYLGLEGLVYLSLADQKLTFEEGFGTAVI